MSWEGVSVHVASGWDLGDEIGILDGVEGSDRGARESGF